MNAYSLAHQLSTNHDVCDTAFSIETHVNDEQKYEKLLTFTNFDISSFCKKKFLIALHNSIAVRPLTSCP